VCRTGYFSIYRALLSLKNVDKQQGYTTYYMKGNIRTSIIGAL